MNLILLFSLFFNICCTLIMLVYSWRIMKLEVTPQWTWALKFLACSIQLIQIGFSVFFINDISTFISGFAPSTLIFSYSIGALRSALLAAFIVRVHATLLLKFPKK